MVKITTEIRHGDCLDVLKDYPQDFFDLIVTSPPYADSRLKTYGGIKPSDYSNWFLPRGEQFFRVLKPSGTFILNIKERVLAGERSTYVIELILGMKRQGWLWTEEFIWHKKNAHPGKWPNRFRDSWERCLQFNKEKKFKMNQDAVMTPTGEWAHSRLQNLGKNDTVRFNSRSNSGFGKNISNWVGRDKVYPSNVLHLSTETSNKSHSAAFPRSLPNWFIRLFTDKDDWILDPFLGSGTTCEVSQKLGRNSVGIEIIKDYVDAVRGNLARENYRLLEEKRKYGRPEY